MSPLNEYSEHVTHYVLTRPICSRPTAKVGRFPSADSRVIKILNMIDRESLPTITESVVQLAYSVVQSAYSVVQSAICTTVWVWALRAMMAKFGLKENFFSFTVCTLEQY